MTGKYENYRTPEQEIPDHLLSYPWETCMTMATSWSYVPGDIYKPTGKIIHMLAEIVCKGGNYLLNIGPSPEGEWADSAYVRLRDIGDWMKINGQAIYRSRPVEPYKSGKWCFTGGPDGTVYAIYLAEPGEHMAETMLIKGLKVKNGSIVDLLGAKAPLKCKRAEDGDLLISVPARLRQNPPCKHAWVFAIRLAQR